MSEIEFKNRVSLGPVHEELLDLIERHGGLEGGEIRTHARLSAGTQLSTALLYLTERDLVKYDNGKYFPRGRRLLAQQQQTEENTMNVKLKGKTKQKLYNAIPETGSIGMKSLVKKIGMTAGNVSVTMSSLKKLGLVASQLVEGQAQYSRLQSGQTPPPPKVRKKKSSVKTTHEKKPLSPKQQRAIKAAEKALGQQKSHMDDIAEELLQNNLAVAQENLDAYVMSVCDRDVLGFFQQQRDAARKHLTDYQARAGA